MKRWTWVEIFPGVWAPVEVAVVPAEAEVEERWTVDASELPY